MHIPRGCAQVSLAGAGRVGPGGLAAGPLAGGRRAEDDYVDAVEQAGLAVITIDYPGPHDPAAWSTDEASIPPCIVIEARKARDRVT
jgi:hypothetical protein